MAVCVINPPWSLSLAKSKDIYIYAESRVHICSIYHHLAKLFGFQQVERVIYRIREEDVAT